jgi:uncharacterized protein YcaQ
MTRVFNKNEWEHKKKAAQWKLKWDDMTFLERRKFLKIIGLSEKLSVLLNHELPEKLRIKIDREIKRIFH